MRRAVLVLLALVAVGCSSIAKPSASQFDWVTFCRETALQGSLTGTFNNFMKPDHQVMSVRYVRSSDFVKIWFVAGIDVHGHEILLATNTVDGGGTWLTVNDEAERYSDIIPFALERPPGMSDDGAQTALTHARKCVGVWLR